MAGALLFHMHPFVPVTINIHIIERSWYFLSHDFSVFLLIMRVWFCQPGFSEGASTEHEVGWSNSTLTPKLSHQL